MFHKNPFSGSRVVRCGRTDGKTDRQTDSETDTMRLIVVFAILRMRLNSRQKLINNRPVDNLGVNMELCTSLSFSEKYQYTHKYIRRPTYPHRVVADMDYANYFKCYRISPSDKLLRINSPGNL